MPLDLFLDRDGLWSTRRVGRAASVMRPVPTTAGVMRGRAWLMPIEADLGKRLAALIVRASAPAKTPAVILDLDPVTDRANELRANELRAPVPPDPVHPTRRAGAVAGLIGAALRAASGPVVPCPTAQGWRWRAAPEPALAAELDSAIQACVDLAAVQDDRVVERLAELVDDIVHVRVCAALAEPHLAWLDEPAPAGQRAPSARWADHVVARNGGGARLALVLSPALTIDEELTTDEEAPRADHRRGARHAGPAPADPHPLGLPPSTWVLTPMAVGLAESTTRLPVATADPAMFGAGEAPWQRWRTVEADMLARAWGPALPGFADVLGSGQPANLAVEEVIRFVDDVLPRLLRGGFDVVAPGGLLRSASVRRRVRSTRVTSDGALGVAGLGLAAEVLVDGEPLTDAEVTMLAAAKSELVAVRGRWLRIDPSDSDGISALARRLRDPVRRADLLADDAFDGVEWDATATLPTGLSPARPVTVPDGVMATLRHYQHDGLEWLTWLADNGVGGVLADDMGLGKTLQVLAWVLADHRGPTLVVCPVTLVDTWLRQAEQFTPTLRVVAFHGGDRGLAEQAVADADVVVTTYGLLARDDDLVQIAWHRMVLDEAQAIKNPDTRAARTARAIDARHRLVVTGTPVENHVGDLWSLMAVAQPGLLPRRATFQKRFAEPSPADLARLRAVVGPFLLRRVKTDPGILPELPDREVIRVDCTLTREQVGAYEAIVADMVGQLEELRSVARRGPDEVGDPGQMGRRAAVLAGIGRLKQVCVHPALLTESRDALGARSGKVTRLIELCGQIVEEGQAVVVFTQFASFVPELAAHLGHELGVQVATLTGSDSRAARARAVAAFSDADGPPILVASLKAGGTGLTLVRANHVVHLDRWWNPAVEDQASDRVWRIGQEQKVSVHVLVCPGTLEDRIDEALRAKREVAASVVRSTESSITELTDADLTRLVGLVHGRVLG